MKKFTIQVPKGIRYMSQWTDFKLPEEPHIMDKKVPGCGFTEWCLTNNQDLVLCSPRKVLLQNKEEQHRGEVFLVKTKLDQELEIDRNLLTDSKNKNKQAKLEEERMLKQKKFYLESYKGTYNLLYDQLSKYIYDRKFYGKSVKIMTTYDSFHLVRDILEHKKILGDYQIIIDEFQAIFTDAKFKSTAELEFVENLQGIQKVCYLSATPMMENYLEQVDEFKNLNYYELDWSTLDPDRIIIPNIKIKIVNSITTKAKEIIETYLSGNYEKFRKPDGTVIESKEAVFFVNSVTNICNIISGARLSSDQCCIICSNTENNQNNISTRLGLNFKIEGVPLKGQSRKMFTFCTRTVYLGADFYSDNARSFILSDSNVSTLAVDIRLDLPQIIGRQRLRENPWKNEAEFYFRSLSKNAKKNINKNAYNSIIDKKIEVTESLLRAYKSIEDRDKYNLANTYKILALTQNYNNDYVSVNEDLSGNLIPVINKLAMVAERRAFDIQQLDYTDWVTVFNRVDEVTGDIYTGEEVRRFKAGYDFLGDSTRNKLRYLCESPISEKGFARMYEMLEPRIKSYLSFGKRILRDFDYRPEELDKLISNKIVEMKMKIFETFKVGEKYPSSKIKITLKNIYEKYNYNKKAKATDLQEYFELKKCKIKNFSTGSWDNGFEIVNEKK